MNESQLLALGGAGFATLYGLVLGSFFNVAISRMPWDQSLWPRSRCPSCDHAIAGYDNIPVLSYVLLRGKCRACAEGISIQYPLVEILAAALGLAVYRSIAPDLIPSWGVAAAWVHHFYFIGVLVVGGLIDVRHHIIPDETTIYSVPVAIALAAVVQFSGFVGWWPIDLKTAVIGCALWGLLAFITKVIATFLAGRDALGWGDVKLAALIGAATGPWGAFLIMMWASILGAILGIGGKLAGRDALPLGPSLAFAGVAYAGWGHHILPAAFPQFAYFLGM